MYQNVHSQCTKTEVRKLLKLRNMFNNRWLDKITIQTMGFHPRSPANVSGHSEATRTKTYAGLEEWALDQDDFWLNQPKIINLIAFKVLEQLYGLK